MLMTNEFQFEDETATQVIRKSRFGIVFVLLTLIPMMIVVLYLIWVNAIGMNLVAFNELLTYFSPLTRSDSLSIYFICNISLVLPFVLYKSYNGMETRLTKFAQIYSQCMRGII